MGALVARSACHEAAESNRTWIQKTKHVICLGAPARILKPVNAEGRDDGIAVHYSTIAKGTPIYASDGAEVGKVVSVSDNARENILDGFIFEDAQGQTRFVDAPEVQRTFERAVELNIDSAAAAELGPPSKNSGGGRLFGR
jgi:hypothetical protein